MTMINGNFPLALLILDGWGHRADDVHNGITQAHTPFFDELLKKYPHTLIDGSGPAVGLPKGIMGNSEVGHMNIGAGRIIFSGLSQIYNAIEEGDFFTNPALTKAVSQVKDHNSTLHIMGLLSDGAVHSHQDHLYALLKLAKTNGLKKVAIHCFLDGRDTAPKDGVKFLKALQKQIKDIGVGKIASLSGRYFAMDRDNNWERIQKAYQAMTGQSSQKTKDPIHYLEQEYQAGRGDEFVKPVHVIQDDEALQKIQSEDAMVFFNFRADRAKQMSFVFTDKDFSFFDRDENALPKVFVAFSPYDDKLNCEVAFVPSYPTQTLGEIIAQNGWSQLRLAETEKYAHVTFFFNGGKDQVFQNEKRVLIPSAKDVATYDLKPEMRAFEVTEALVENLNQNHFALIVCNFANTDMVGHTAIPEAIVKATQTVDTCLAKIIPEVLKKNGTVLITSDHGNAETMVDENGEPMTAHTTNLVPFILVSNNLKDVTLKENGGRLCDISPTILEILNVKQPSVMTGQSLIQKYA